jgi:hypothetical protein
MHVQLTRKTLNPLDVRQVVHLKHAQVKPLESRHNPIKQQHGHLS